MSEQERLLERSKNFSESQDSSSDRYRNALDVQKSIVKEKQKILKLEMDYVAKQIFGGKITGDRLTELKDKYSQLISQMDAYRNELAEINFAKVQSNLDALGDKIDDVDHKLEMSKSSMARYKEGSKEYANELKNQILLIKEKARLTQQEIDLINKELKSTGLSNARKKELRELLEDLTEQMAGYNNEIYDIKQEQADKVIEMYKEMYEKQKELALKALDDEMDAKRKAYEEQIRMIDEVAEKEDYNKNLGKMQTERQDIQNQINRLSNDDSREALDKRKDLEKKLAEIDEQIGDTKKDHERDLRKQNLQDHLDAEEEAYEKKKKSTEKYYDNLINDERAFAKIREDILKGNLDNIKKSFGTFATFIKNNSDEIGKSISQNLLDKLESLNKQLSSSKLADLTLSRDNTSDKLDSVRDQKKSIASQLAKNKKEEDSLKGKKDKKSQDRLKALKKQDIDLNNKLKSLTNQENTLKKSLDALLKEIDRITKEINSGKYNKTPVKTPLKTPKKTASQTPTPSKPPTKSSSSSLSLNSLSLENNLDNLTSLREIYEKSLANSQVSLANIFGNIKDVTASILPKFNIDIKTPETVSGQPVTLSIDNLINIEGNADKSTIEDLKRVSDMVLNRLKRELNMAGIRR